MLSANIMNKIKQANAKKEQLKKKSKVKRDVIVEQVDKEDLSANDGTKTNKDKLVANSKKVSELNLMKFFERQKDKIQQFNLGKPIDQ